MAFTKMKLTTFGSNIEAKCHQGKGIHFTRIAIGDGLLGTGSMVNRTDLVSERHSMKIDGIVVTENSTQSAVIATLDNSSFTEGFPYRELALFAEDQDTGQEGVYLYDNAGQECEFLGLREDGVVIHERIKIIIRIDQESQISFEESGNPLYLSVKDVTEMIDQHNKSTDSHPQKADLGEDGKVLAEQIPEMDYVPTSEKGQAEGVATLGKDGKVPAKQLPEMDYVPTSEKGQAEGVATLGKDGKVPDEQLPEMDYVPISEKGQADGVATLGKDGKLTDSQIPVQQIMAVTNAAEYSAEQTYALDDYCTKDEKLYKCITAITEAEAWTADHWTETNVGAELTALARQLSETAGLKIELLWENAAPTSEFPAQTISLDLSDYNWVLIWINKRMEPAAELTHSFAYLCMVGASNDIACLTPSLEGMPYAFTRFVTVTSTGIAFDACYWKYLNTTSKTYDNGYHIPTRIYGIKL